MVLQQPMLLWNDRGHSFPLRRDPGPFSERVGLEVYSSHYSVSKRKKWKFEKRLWFDRQGMNIGDVHCQPSYSTCEMTPDQQMVHRHLDWHSEVMPDSWHKCILQVPNPTWYRYSPDPHREGALQFVYP